MAKKIQLYNTLNRKKEDFEPVKTGEVSMYMCGPTVYDRAHIGNMRTYIFEDILRRALELADYKVNEVMNITDVDDKTIVRSSGKKADFEVLTKKYEKLFLDDLKKLNIEVAQTLTRPTEYIDKIVSFIQELLDKGIAYKASDGSIYFSIEKYPQYGSLAHLDRENLKVGARVAQDEYDKENPCDFALWKAWVEDDGEIFWDPSTKLGAGTSLGKGRPGWSIECSVMSQDKLGDTFDIHGGAVDLIFPHHENEIAQSWGKTGKKLANYWVHGEHLMVSGAKMSKSLGNLYTLEDLQKKGFSPLDFRMLVLSAHYRAKLNFTWDSIAGAHEALKRLNDFALKVNKDEKDGEVEFFDSFYEKFQNAIFDDLDTPRALAIVFDALRGANDKNFYGAAARDFMDKIDQVFALNLVIKYEDKDGIRFEIGIPENVVTLALDRKAKRLSGDYDGADALRAQINELEFEIEDFKDYALLTKK